MPATPATDATTLDSARHDLPECVLRCFWDYDLDGLSWKDHRSMIVRRVAESGGWDALRWLLRRAQAEELRSLIIKRRGRGMTPRRLRFWGLLLDLPRGQVDTWIESQRVGPWATRLNP